MRVPRDEEYDRALSEYQSTGTVPDGYKLLDGFLVKSETVRAERPRVSVEREAPVSGRAMRCDASGNLAYVDTGGEIAEDYYKDYDALTDIFPSATPITIPRRRRDESGFGTPPLIPSPLFRSSISGSSEELSETASLKTASEGWGTPEGECNSRVRISGIRVWQKMIPAMRLWAKLIVDYPFRKQLFYRYPWRIGNLHITLSYKVV